MTESLRAELERYLESLNIETNCVEHPPVKRKRFNVASRLFRRDRSRCSRNRCDAESKASFTLLSVPLLVGPIRTGSKTTPTMEPRKPDFKECTS